MEIIKAKCHVKDACKHNGYRCNNCSRNANRVVKDRFEATDKSWIFKIKKGEQDGN